jgi:putative SOS response-associated peptidase YedK
MCGRITLRTPLTVLMREFELAAPDERQRLLFEPRYNIAPTQEILAVRAEQLGKRVAVPMRWGLIPAWSKEPGSGPPLINARAETVPTKPAFRTAFRSRRCLIPTDGFYEWQRLPDGKKQPYHIHRPDHGPFALAGLWERWDRGPTIESCTIITTTANQALSALHDRMPVVLAANDYSLWLDPAVTDPAALGHLLAPAADEELVAEPVSTHVNNARHDDPRCVEPVG